LCIVLGGLVIDVACGSSSNGGGGGGGSGACADLVTAVCGKYNECSPTLIKTLYGDVATCVSRLNLSCASFDQWPGTSWTAEKMEACAQTISGAGCENGLLGAFATDACQTTPGSLPNGSPCGDSSQCAGGRCDKSTPSDGGFSTQNTCGVCETGTNLSCGDAGACTSPDECRWDSLNGYTCVTPVPEGASCSNSTPCVSGLNCRDGICKKPLGIGAACTTTSFDCDSLQGLSCIDMTCQLPTFVGPGETCSSPSIRCTGSDCISTLTDAGITGTCVARAADNAPCNNSDGPRCLSPAKCLDGVCKVPDYTQCK